MTILIFLLVVAGLSFILIKGSQYIAGLGEILDLIWNFITGNLFGFLVLALCLFFIIMFIRKMDYSKLKPVQFKSKKRRDEEKAFRAAQLKYEQSKADRTFYEAKREQRYDAAVERRLNGKK